MQYTKYFFFLLTALLLHNCNSTDSGKVQSELQRIYSGISDGNLEEVNEKLVSENALTTYPLANNGSARAIYGQVRVIESQPIGSTAELIVYQVEVHEKNRRIINRLNSKGYKEMEKAGQIRSVDKESGIVVYVERKVAFRLKGDQTRYIIDPTKEAISRYFENQEQEVRALIAQYS
ncbi:MAG: hypothetical protein RIC19_11010 [Phaeodactylibacter sp.]|uniref:hypothetical protein n=1 Tax=Phaeodactylibacter sp. TaxID=1940289 RepID=UPI0032EF2CAE